MTRQTLSIVSLLWVVSKVEYVVADGKCSKGKDGSQVCVDHMPVAANVVIGVATITILALLLIFLICLKKHRNTPSRSQSQFQAHSRNLSQPDFLFDSEQMQGPPTIIETHYNPSSGRVDVLSAKSPSFSSSQSSFERKSSEVDPYYAGRALPHRGASPALPPRGPSPALPPRAKSPMHNREGVPALSPGGRTFIPASQWAPPAPAPFSPGAPFNPAAPALAFNPAQFNPAAQWNPNMQMQMTQKSNRLSLPVSFVRMPVPMTAPPAQAQFAFNAGGGAGVGGQLGAQGGASAGVGAGEGGERKPPSYDVEPTTYPQPPQTAFVTSNFERPPQHPSLRRAGRYNN